MQDTLDVLTTSMSEEESVAHYGVMGMKWGQRKERARLAGMSHRQYKQQLKADNRMAFKLGRDATIADRLLDYTTKKSNKIINKAYKSKRPSSDLKMARAYANRAKAERRAKEARAVIKQHHASLIKKYGGVNVTNIKKDKQGRIDEKIHNGKDYLRAFALTAVFTGPYGRVYFIPRGKNSTVRREYNKMNYDTTREVRYRR